MKLINKLNIEASRFFFSRQQIDSNVDRVSQNGYKIFIKQSKD